jgi:DNA-binding CsgD family transcriptional regulator/tetratricopeptide (TPR) repeat protein
LTGEEREGQGMAITQPRICPIVIGRERELAFGTQLLDEARRGKGTLLLLGGEAGVGKSRLLRELTGGGSRTGFRLLVGVCQEHDRDFPFAPFLDAFRQYAYSATPAEVAALVGTDRAIFSRLLPELGLTERDILPPLPPEQEKRCIFEAFVGLLTRLARDSPLLLALEDLHWADETSLELLQLLPRRLATAPVMIVATARDDEPGSAFAHWRVYLERNRLMARVDLVPLTGPETTRMIEATLDGPVPGGVIDAIHRRAEGNPFLTEELLHALTEGMATQPRASMWEAVTDLDIPSSVTETVDRRVDTLDAAVRRIAELAAVAGRRFSFDLLRDLSGCDDLALIAALRTLIARQLMVEEHAGGEQRFAFRHALTRDAVYRRLLGPERRQLHRIVARVLSEGGAHHLMSVGELGFHHEAAEEWERALPRATEAGDAARALFANAEALSHYQRALRAAGRIGPAAEAEAMTLAYKCAQVLAILGEFEAAQTQYAQALDDARRRHDSQTEQHILFDLAGHYASRDYDTAYRYGTESLALARANGEQRDQALALNRLANVLVNQSHLTAGLAIHEEALGIFERLGDRWGIADSLDYMGMTQYLSGDIPEARERFSRALTIFEECGDRERIASCLANRSPYYPALDGACPFDADPETSLADAERAVRLCREIGWVAGETYAHVALGCARIGDGDYGEGLRELMTAETMAAQINHQQWGVIARIAHSIALSQLGDVAGARAILSTARAAAVAMGAAQFVAQTDACLAACAVALDALDVAEVALAPLLPANNRPQTIAERRALLAQAALALRRGDGERALDCTRRLMLPPQTGEPPRPTPAILLMRAEALAALGDAEAARAGVMQAHALAAERGPRGLCWRISIALAVLEKRVGRADRAAMTRARHELDALLACLPDARLREILLQSLVAQAGMAVPERRLAPDELTRRERQVVAEIVRGKSNREIAETLFIAEKTVETHITNSLSKLGFHSRSQLAVWAANQQKN